MQNDRRTANIDRDALSLIFERVSHISPTPQYTVTDNKVFSCEIRLLGVVRMTNIKLSAISVEPLMPFDLLSNILSLPSALMILTKRFDQKSRDLRSILQLLR